jgi:hypothetical protein
MVEEISNGLSDFDRDYDPPKEPTLAGSKVHCTALWKAHVTASHQDGTEFGLKRLRGLDPLVHVAHVSFWH